MNPVFKRELLLWGTCVVLVGGFIGLGQVLAPEVPPKPVEPSKNPGDFKKFVEYLKQQNSRNEAIREHNQFLTRWYQWGAGVGIVLLLIYTWWRPPWRIPEKTSPTDRDRRRKKTAAQLPMSPTALLTLLVTIVLLIGFAVFLAVKVF